MTTIDEILKRELESPARTKDGHRIFDGTALGLHRPLNPSRHLGRQSHIRKMAERCYGYGNWDAPYWFIGLGESKANETIEDRAKIWSELEQDGLCDCRAFHTRIGENRWHERPVQFQPTWRRLMLLLMSFLGNDVNDQSLLRNYQSKNWGMREDDTCVCELFGLPAPNFKAYESLMDDFTPDERKDIAQKRIDFLRQRIFHRNRKPTFVVMYGRSARKQWSAIAGCSLPDDKVCRVGTTLIVSAIHPIAHGVEDAYWVDLGKKLKTAANQS